ncbi:hypothetical protein WJX73_007345 [Symbiochloris irregularis]|uniref:Uncharacterized protein n=1 Tax=Symbiochloris irregularis TaxID=706552 RepID=A0AAW1P0E7_9CHLO
MSLAISICFFLRWKMRRQAVAVLSWWLCALLLQCPRVLAANGEEDLALHPRTRHTHKTGLLHSSLPYDFSDTFSNAQHLILSGKSKATHHTVNLHIWIKAAIEADKLWVRGFFVADDMDELHIRADSVLDPPPDFFNDPPSLFLRNVLDTTQHNFALLLGPYYSMYDMNLTLPLASIDTGFELRYNDWERAAYWVPRHALDRHVVDQAKFATDKHDAKLIIVFFAPFNVLPDEFACRLEQATRYHQEVQGFDQVIQMLHGPYLSTLASNAGIQTLVKQGFLRLVVWQEFQWPAGVAQPYIDQFLMYNFILLAFWGRMANVRILLNDPDEYVATFNGQRFRDLFLEEHGESTRSITITDNADCC